MATADKILADKRLTLFTCCVIGGLALKILISSIYFNLGGIRHWWVPGTSHAAPSAAAEPSADSLPRLLASLKTERQSLVAREAALQEKERQITTLKQEIESRLGELTGVQERVNRLLEEEQKIQDDRQRHLITTLEAMPTERSGKLIEKLDEELVVTLLRRMNGKEAGKILGLLDADKAARISKRLFR